MATHQVGETVVCWILLATRIPGLQPIAILSGDTGLR